MECPYVVSDHEDHSFSYGKEKEQLVWVRNNLNPVNASWTEKINSRKGAIVLRLWRRKCLSNKESHLCCPKKMGKGFIGRESHRPRIIKAYLKIKGGD